MMNETKNKTNNGLKYSVCAAAMMISLSACLPDDSASVSYETQAEFIEAQSQYYANAVGQYALNSAHALTNASGWATQSIPEGTLDLTSVDFGSLDLGDAEIFVESAFCETTAGKAVHYTWFDSADSAGDFSIKGIGSGDVGYLVTALSQTVSSDNLGTYNGTSIEMGTSGATQAIPTGCGSLDIPNGSPVIVTPLTLPTDAAGDTSMSRYEYRTISCGGSDVGNIQQQVLITVDSNGNVEVGGMQYSDLSEVSDASWTTISDSCSSVTEKDSYEVQAGMTSSGIDFSALVSPAAGGADNALASLLQETLDNVACNELVTKIEEGEEVEDAQEALFDTCGSTIEISALSSITATAASLQETEIATQSCSEFLGGETCFTDSVDGDVGEACADAWSGEAVLQREIWLYTVSTSGQTGPGCGDCEETTTVEQWTGLSLECSRYAQLTIECETRLPEYADSSVYTDLTSAGFIYDRSNNISGWADAENIVPNAPDNPTWTGFSYDCSWSKNTTWDCSAYPETTQVQEGSADRLIAVKNIAGAVDVGDWDVTQVAQCSEGETWGCSAISGSTEVRGGSASRILEILNPAGETNDTGLVVNQTAQCSSTRDFTCPAGTVTQTGMQERIWEVLDPSGTVDESGDWTTTRNSSCSDSRETFGCEQRVEERTYTGTAPYTGNWSGWTTVSLVDNCGGSTGGSGGGSDVCIMAGARVAMADGSTKDVAELEVGDVTIAGRVMQKFARHYDAANHLTEAGRLMTGEGLFNVDGIVGTGRHAFLGKQGWTELSEAAEANLESHDIAMLYNAVMENHILPLVGDSGEVYYYADEMNNIDGLSERAVMRMMAAEKIAA